MVDTAALRDIPDSDYGDDVQRQRGIPEPVDEVLLAYPSLRDRIRCRNKARVAKMRGSTADPSGREEAGERDREQARAVEVVAAPFAQVLIRNAVDDGRTRKGRRRPGRGKREPDETRHDRHAASPPPVGRATVRSPNDPCQTQTLLIRQLHGRDTTKVQPTPSTWIQNLDVDRRAARTAQRQSSVARRREGVAAVRS